MIDNLKIFDSHVHIGDAKLCKKILETTIYKQKYKLYSCIDPLVVEETDDYLHQLDGFYAIPLVFKEMSVSNSNIYVSEIDKKYSNGVGVFLLENNDCDLDIYRYNILKEHFLLHHEDEWCNRTDSYDFLNSTNGFLILHCRDRVRISYIDFLHKQFPNINIIIAHMGRNVFEDYKFNVEIIEHFKNNDKIIMDTSTVLNASIIKLGIDLLGIERILFGSDFPFSVLPGVKVENFYMFLNDLNLKESLLEKLMYKNSNNILKSLKKRCNDE